MKLWPDEYEAHRAEARAAANAAQEMMRLEVDDSGTTLERVRRMREGLAAMIPSLEGVEEREIAGVRCRIFRPEAAARGVYLHFHGGGMMLGAPEMSDFENRARCDTHGLAVVSADYRLAPEHPYPAGPDDGEAVAAWLIEHAKREFGSERLLVGGESAGGYMAAITLLRVRDRLKAIERFAGANLLFGVYDWGLSPSQKGIRVHEGPDWLDPEGIAFFTDLYLPGRSADQRRDPAISPAYADLRELPPAILSVGSTDHLLDDSLMLGARWQAANANAELAVFPDCPHGFHMGDHVLARHCRKRIDAFLRAALA